MGLLRTPLVPQGRATDNTGMPSTCSVAASRVISHESRGFLRCLSSPPRQGHRLNKNAGLLISAHVRSSAAVSRS